MWLQACVVGPLNVLNEQLQLNKVCMFWGRKCIATLSSIRSDQWSWMKFVEAVTAQPMMA